MDDRTAPKRAFRLTLQLEADTRKDMVNALLNLAARVDRDQVTNGVWGSPTDGAIYELLQSPEQTHEAYFAEVHKYLDNLRAASEIGRTGESNG